MNVIHIKYLHVTSYGWSIKERQHTCNDTFLCLRYEVAGGIMFSGCPSVRPSVRTYVRTYVRTSRSRDRVI